MSYLLDTNVLLRHADREHAMHEDVVAAIDTLTKRQERLCIFPQNVAEFWNVYTRPRERNGLGHTAAEAWTEVTRIKALFPLFLDTPAVYGAWEDLVIMYGITGINVHDARLVAAMQVHGISHVLTFNVQDFRRYTGITVVHPTDVQK